MTPDEIAAFVVRNVEPLEDKFYGNRYRVAARLKDGTYLPCVVLQSRKAHRRLVLRRFREDRWLRPRYWVVAAFFASLRSRIPERQLQDVEVSPFAGPIKLLRNIQGETSMGWTAFVVEMKDGTMCSYGTQFSDEFFDIPQGYRHSDIRGIHSGMAYSKLKGLVNARMLPLEETRPYREKPFRTCYLKGLDSVR
jgi:hypothetical protein